MFYTALDSTQAQIDVTGNTVFQAKTQWIYRVSKWLRTALLSSVQPSSHLNATGLTSAATGL